MAKINKSDGFNDSEKYLCQLCKKTFLNLWYYPNIFTDRSNLQKKGTGKELCDVLIIFKNYIILISDKNIAFKENWDEKIGWKRWYKNAINKSAKQIYMAESWIKNHPNRIFIDSRCQQPFPLELPSSDKIKFYRILIAKGLSNKYTKTLSSFLSINLKFKGLNDHLENPFQIGFIGEHINHEYIHVFDEVAVEIIFKELDTIVDFINYLEAKERFIKSGKLLGAKTEEDLLAYYQTNTNSENKYHFPASESTFDFIDGSFYLNFIQLPQYIKGKEENNKNNHWDNLIDYFSDFTINDNWMYLYLTNKIATNIDSILVLQELASEDRLHRRMYSKTLTDFFSRNKNGFRAVFDKHDYRKIYVFYIESYDDRFTSDNDYFGYRNINLMDYIKAVKFKCPKSSIIIGMAFNNRNDKKHFESLIYYDCNNWTVENYNEAEKIINQKGFFVNHSVDSMSEKYYPITKTKTVEKKKRKNLKKIKRKIQKRSRKNNR